MYRLVCAGLFSLLGFLSITICMDAKENYSSVSKLKIPNFNESGHLDWELHAATVSPQGNDLFLTTDPILYLYSDQLIETTAKSERGVFSLRLGQAYGDGIFNVEGNGFTATGKDWIWNNSTKRGENHNLSLLVFIVVVSLDLKVHIQKKQIVTRDVTITI